jgi:hypothetical protein
MIRDLQVHTGCTDGDTVSVKKAIKYVKKISVSAFTRKLTKKSPPRYAEHRLRWDHSNIDSVNE